MAEITRISLPRAEITLRSDASGLSARVSGNGLKAMVKSTLLIERHVKQLMTESPRGGREYLIGVRRRRVHRSSAPGEPPAVRSGILRNSVRSAAFAVPGGGIEGVVGTRTLYAPFLEFGTRLMAARPVWARALQEKAQEIAAIFQKMGL